MLKKDLDIVTNFIIGTIGDVILAESMFGRVINAERMLKKELGGGTTLDLGIYNIQFSQIAFSGKK